LNEWNDAEEAEKERPERAEDASTIFPRRGISAAQREPPNEAVLVTAARLRMLLNVKSPIRAAARDGGRYAARNLIAPWPLSTQTGP
jgi:hypothetical protein